MGTTDEAIACRLAEASCGSKWSQPHATVLAEIKQSFPKYSAVFDKLGITESMTAIDVVNHIKSAHMCDKKAKSKILRALDDDEPDVAIRAMANQTHFQVFQSFHVCTSSEQLMWHAHIPKLLFYRTDRFCLLTMLLPAASSAQSLFHASFLSVQFSFQYRLLHELPSWKFICTVFYRP